MTPHEILEYIVEHKGHCPLDTRLCKICPLQSENRSCIDTVFPNEDIPFEGINAVYYKAAYHLLMDILMDRAIEEAGRKNSAPSTTS